MREGDTEREGEREREFRCERQRRVSLITLAKRSEQPGQTPGTKRIVMTFGELSKEPHQIDTLPTLYPRLHAAVDWKGKEGGWGEEERKEIGLALVDARSLLKCYTCRNGGGGGGGGG